MNQLPADASTDQNNVPNGYYRRSNGMVMQLPPAPPATNDLPKIDINDATALKELATQVLVEIIQKSPRNVSLVAACRELLDRCVGKAPQSIAMEVKDSRLNASQLDDLIRLAAHMREPLIIPPMPKKVSNVGE